MMKVESFWDEQYWLPPGVTWADVEKFQNQGGSIPHLSDLWIVIPIAFSMILIRRVFEEAISTPIANRVGIKNKRIAKPESCPVLEKYSKSHRRLDRGDLPDLLSKLDKDWNERRIERWFRRKKAQGARPLTAKFGETMWRGFFYTVAYSYGTYVVMANTWFWDTLDCWRNFPLQDLTWDVKYYYIAELAFYLSLCCTLLSDTIRKDFLAQIIHHVATIALITFSYACGFTRIGVLVMWLHDISDIFLEVAKCFVYAEKQAIADHFFNIFAVVFFISRIIYYPFVVLHTTWIKSMWLFEPFFGYYFFNFLLMVLQILHLYWFYLILDMAYRLLKGKNVTDSRSDEEFSVDESDNDNQNLSDKKAK